VLNFGQQAPIDSAHHRPHSDEDYAKAREVLADLKKVPGVVDATSSRFPTHRR